LECERLQGFPDNYTEGFSDTQRYKMLGNSIATPVLKYIGERILMVEQESMKWSKAG
jgi:DNA (cytosine-5)-methyltransferase 1